MSGKRCVAYFRSEETKRKRKLLDDDAAIHDDDDANVNELAENFGGLSTSLPNYTPCRSNPSGSVNDHDSANNQKLGDSSASTVILLEEPAENSSSTSTSTSIESNEYLVYKKRLTRDDVYYHRLEIPVESGKQFLPEPSIFQGRYELTEMIVIDHENHTWEFMASFYDLNNSYLFWKNWDKYVSKYGLQPGDVIFLYEDPDDDSRSHLLIEYQKATVNISS